MTVGGKNIKKARKQFAYIPLLDRLRVQYRDPNRARLLSTYRESFTGNQQNTTDRAGLRDVFDGDLYQSYHLNQLGLFRDNRDIALHMSLDGVQVVNMRHHEVTPVILINLNLPPEERYKVENILASMVIPGPKKPNDLDSFLRPLVEELKGLDHGAEAFDANTGQTFTLRAWVTMVTGDGPAIAEAIGFKRPGNAYRPCRCCLIKGKHGPAQGQNKNRTYYVPHTDYNFRHPPFRGDDADTRELIALVEEANSAAESKRWGITRASILLELRSLHFTRSFPMDLMHCVLLNITETLFKLWIREKLKFEKSAPPVPNRHLSTFSINAISKTLAKSRKDTDVHWPCPSAN